MAPKDLNLVLHMLLKSQAYEEAPNCLLLSRYNHSGVEKELVKTHIVVRYSDGALLKYGKS